LQSDDELQLNDLSFSNLLQDHLRNADWLYAP